MRRLNFITVLLCLHRATHVSSISVGAQRVAHFLNGSIVSDGVGKTSDFRQCSFPPDARVRDANLTTAEAGLLPLICWKNDTSMSEGLFKTSVRKGIPSGVICKATQW